MKIIQVHNYYQLAGGEDVVVEGELSLLRDHGNEVVTYYRSNSDIQKSSSRIWTLVRLLGTGVNTIWNHQTYREFRKLLDVEKPDVVHCHNTFPLISPSIHWACAKKKVPVVQTLHNYRLLCLNASLFRFTKRTKNTKIGLGPHKRPENEPSESKKTQEGTSENLRGTCTCELCLRKAFKYPGIKFRCYRDSLAGSFVVALMLLVHHVIGTWSKKVSTYIAMTEFQKQRIVEGGLPKDKVWVKPSFIQTPGERPTIDKKTYCLYVGRLSPEKGCDVLIRAWYESSSKRQTTNRIGETAGGRGDTSPVSSDASSGNQMPQLLIVGDGPDRPILEKLAMHPASHIPHPTIKFLGRKPNSVVLSLMRNALFIVSPSVCYETFGIVVLEAGMLETPSIVGEPGAVAGLVNDGETGLLFSMGDEIQLAERLEWAFRHPEKMRRMGHAARMKFEREYSPESNYKQLAGVYRNVVSVPMP